MSLKKFFRSFRYAFHGLYLIAKEEQSFKIQLIVGCTVLVLLVVFPFDAWERILMILMVAAVWILEVINSIFERISDALKPRLNPMVRDIKDMMAGAVLLTSITAVVVATLIFASYFL